MTRHIIKLKIYKITELLNNISLTKEFCLGVSMEEVKSTGEYKIFKKRSGRYGVKSAKGGWINGKEKVEILNKEGFIKAKPPKVEAPVVEESSEEAPAEEAPAEEAKAE